MYVDVKSSCKQRCVYCRYMCGSLKPSSDRYRSSLSGRAGRRQTQVSLTISESPRPASNLSESYTARNQRFPFYYRFEQGNCPSTLPKWRVLPCAAQIVRTIHSTLFSPLWYFAMSLVSRFLHTVPRPWFRIIVLILTSRDNIVLTCARRCQD